MRMAWRQHLIFLLLATLITALAVSLNRYIRDTWVQGGLHADKYGSAPPMQLYEIVLFLVSAFVAVTVPAFTAVRFTTFIESKRKLSDSAIDFRHTWYTIRSGQPIQLITFVLFGLAPLGVLIYLPAL